MRRRLELYRFRYFDTLRQRWLQARYVLEAPDSPVLQTLASKEV